MNEEQHIKLVDLGDRFCRELAEVTANIMSEFPQDVHDEVLMYLQDRTSLYSPYTADHIRRTLSKCVIP